MKVHVRGVSGSLPTMGICCTAFFHQLEFRSRKRGELDQIYLWANTHSSIFLLNSLRNSSSVTLRYTSSFICVVRNLFRKRRYTFRTVYEVRAAVEGANNVSKFHHHNINGGAVDDT
jgi:hypothetical protein